MRSPQLCLLLLTVSLVPGTGLAASTMELFQSPEGSKDSSSPPRTRLDLRAIPSSSLHHPHPAGAQQPSFRPAVPWQAPRQRKAGCKSFYWKTLTSC
ncbi:somatostatin-1-like [Hemicordylus capensis]|uniref:somatostatin-1-like n=1 Tax=Hemicordylus capensis TaxID=884348 RepID=UPI002302A4FA|nr:somatostatin-1-like [Hemicordylus capensis]